MRKHPLLALTITFVASAALIPSTILQAEAAGATPDGKSPGSNLTSATSGSLATFATLVTSATSGASRRPGSGSSIRGIPTRSTENFRVAGLVRPVATLSGAPVLMAQLPRVPRRFLILARRSLANTRAVGLAATAGGVWLELRHCESGGNYSADTGNGYYGAYQFAATTWWGIGYTGLPNQAPPAVQDAAAVRLRDRVGWSAWPQCAAALGL